MRRRLVLAAFLLVVVVGLAAPAPAVAAVAQDLTTTAPPPESPGIIPEPNQGVAPEDAGDRGGALQTAVFLLVVGGTVLMGVIVVRQSRRARAERGF